MSAVLPMTARLVELAERVEKLTGRCRETDGLIWMALNPERVKDWHPPNGVPINGYANRVSPQYTGSLDAAMTLVPEKYTFNIYGQKTGFIARTFPANIMAALWKEIPEETKIVTTAPLALTAASLRARAASEPSHGG